MALIIHCAAQNERLVEILKSRSMLNVSCSDQWPLCLQSMRRNLCAIMFNVHESKTMIAWQMANQAFTIHDTLQFSDGMGCIRHHWCRCTNQSLHQTLCCCPYAESLWCTIFVICACNGGTCARKSMWTHILIKLFWHEHCSKLFEHELAGQ